MTRRASEPAKMIDLYLAEQPAGLRSAVRNGSIAACPVRKAMAM